MPVSCDRSFDPTRVDSLRRIVRRIKAAGATMLLLQVPTSSLDLIKNASYKCSFDRQINEVAESMDTGNVDVSDLKTVGLDDKLFHLSSTCVQPAAPKRRRCAYFHEFPSPTSILSR